MNDDQTLALLEQAKTAIGAELPDMLKNRHPNAIPVAATFAAVVQAEQLTRIRAQIEAGAALAIDKLLA